MSISDEKIKKMIIEEVINVLQEAEKPGWLQHRLNALRARDWRKAGAGSMKDVQRGGEGYETAPGGSLSGYDPRPGAGGAMADVFNPRMREVSPEEEVAPEETRPVSGWSEVPGEAPIESYGLADPEIFELEREFGIRSDKIENAIEALEKAYQHAGSSENKFAGMLLELIKSGEIIKIAEIWADLREALRRRGKLL